MMVQESMDLAMALITDANGILSALHLGNEMMIGLRRPCFTHGANVGEIGGHSSVYMASVRQFVKGASPPK